MKEPFNDSDWDRLIKEHFSEHKVEPSVKTWEKLDTYVENMLAEKRKKRVAWFRLLSFLLLLMLLSLGIYELTREENRTIADSKKNMSPIVQQKNIENKKIEKQIDSIIDSGPEKTQKDDISSSEKYIYPSVLSKDDINEQPSQQQHENFHTNTFANSTSLANQPETNSSRVKKIEEQKKSGGSDSYSQTSKATAIENAQVKNDAASQQVTPSISVANKRKTNNFQAQKIEEQKKSDESNSDSQTSIVTTIENVQGKNDVASQHVTPSISVANQRKTNNSQVQKTEEQKRSDESNSNSLNSITTEDEQEKNGIASQKTTSNEIVADNQTKKNAVLPSVTDSIITQLQDSVALVENTIRSIDSLTENKKTPAQSESATEIKATSFSRFSLEATFSPEYVNRLLTNTNNGNGKTAEYYNNIEKPVQPTYTAHLKIGYSLTNRWKMQLGVGYNYFSQKSNLISDTLGSLQSDAHTCLIETSAGRINFSSSLFHPFINHPEKTPIAYRTTEKYEYLAIPLLFQYKLKEGKTSWNVLAGVSANVLIKSTLRLDINNNNTVIFNDINGLQKTNFSFILGVGVERDLWRRFYFSLMPLLNGTFTPINKGVSVKTYPYYVGLQLGLGYWF